MTLLLIDDVFENISPLENWSCVVKVSNGHRSQVADDHLGWPQMANEAI